MVAVYLSIRIEDAQIAQEIQEGCTLGEGSGVLGCLAIAGTTTDIADADGVGVVPLAVGTDL